MNKKENSWGDLFREISTQTIILIAAGIISSPILFIYRNYIGDQFIKIHHILNDPFNTNAYVLIAVFFLGIAIFWTLNMLKSYTGKSYRDYKKDKFLGVYWIWEYNTLGDVKQNSLQPICPKCNTKMNLLDNSGYLGFPEVIDTLQTEIFCKNSDCDYHNVNNHPFLIFETKLESQIRDEVCSKIDKNLRDMGLKI